MERTVKEGTFCIKAYAVSELAACYCPHISQQAAWKQLKRWIALNPALRDELKSLGYTSGIRSFTPKQVGCIVQRLGEPC
jgi:hypothetical protein